MSFVFALWLAFHPVSADAARVPKCRHGNVLLWYRDSKTFGCSRFTVRGHPYRFKGQWGAAKTVIPTRGTTTR